jgi:tetratricopeptide (TPR) repeat protein
MTTGIQAEPSQPTADDALTLRRSVTSGRTLDAYAGLARFAPFEAWTDPLARRMAEWMCEALGAPKRGRAIALGTVRRAPKSSAGRLARLSLTLRTRSPIAAWEALRSEGALGEDATDADRAELHLLEAQALTRFRDFDPAAAAVRRAGELGASRRRVQLHLARILMERDRYAEALAATEQARADVPDSPDVLGFLAHLHVLLGNTDEGLRVLRHGAARTQSADLAIHLATMLSERRLHDERHEWIERWAERVPLLEDKERLVGLRADCAYDRGDVRGALALLRAQVSPFHSKIADALARRIDDPTAKRVLLDVPFVRQHHMTCVPATLTALAGYWHMPAEHLEVAEAICYDGTPNHSQRAWAEEHGFFVRELTASWDSTRALLDRRVPFTVVIAQGAQAHLQAIVGYDDLRGTLFLRDPFVPVTVEALAEPWFEAWRATGPHAMVLVPVAERARLDGLDFPDADLHDELHRVNAALARHDRGAALVACSTLETKAPRHRLAIAARRAIAAYDRDLDRVLACAQESAAEFPEFAATRLDALACARAVRRREERIAMAEALVRTYPREPLYAEALAVELAADAREHPRAARLVRHALRSRPDRHGPLSLMADLLGSERRFEDALTLRRFAACLGRFDESAAFAYFASAHALGREEEAVALLEARVAELGSRAAGPATTLFRAKEALGRADEGVRAIDTAVERRPNDGDLLLAAADVHAVFGDLDAAQALLGRAEGASKPTSWLRSAAQLALRRGAFGERKQMLERLLEREPLDVSSHVAYASAVAASEGAAAARKVIEGAWSRAPNLRPLAHTYIQWLRGAGAAEVERAARRVLEVDPADAWAQRELTLALLDQGRIDDARHCFDVAAAVAPHDASLECTRAALLTREGRRDEARAALEAALTLDPDRSAAIAELAGYDSAGARESTLEWVGRLVRERSVNGDGISAWYLAVRSLTEPAPLATVLDALLRDRPDLWVTWTTAAKHRTFMGEHPSALALAGEACERFPLVGAVWSAKADALSAAGKADEALGALEHAVRVDSFSEAALSRLAAAYVRSGEASRAKELLVRGVGRLPASRTLRSQLAQLVWARGERDLAFAHVEASLALEPDDAHAWKLLDDWSSSEGRASDAVTRITALCVERPWSGSAALNLARARARHDDLSGALKELDRAIALEPLLQDAHDFRAIVLVLLKRFDDAEAACAPPAFGSRVPRELRGRAAWVRSRRGDLEGASVAMRAVLVENADYVWGWAQLAQWSRQRGMPAAFLEEARQTVTAAPNLAAAHQTLAEAFLERGDRASAKRALERAIDLAPSDASVVTARFELALEDGETARAEALLPLFRASSATDALAAEVRVLAARGDADRALAVLRALAVDSRTDAPTLELGRRACVLAGWSERCVLLFRDLLDDEGAHASVGQVWVRWRILDGDLAGVAAVMRCLDPKRSAARAAAMEWLVVLGARQEKEARGDAARLVRERFAPCDDLLWGHVANALLGSAIPECVTWTNDWRDRPAAPSWALLSAASSRREVGRDEEAFEIVRRAADLPDDGGSRSHRTWLAFELAMRGEGEASRRSLERAGDLRDVPLLQTLSEITDAVLTMAEGQRAMTAFRRARAKLSTTRAACGYTVLARAHERATALITRQAGLAGTVWKHRQRLAVAAAVCAVVAFLVFGASTGSSLAPSSTSSTTPNLLPLIVPLFWIGRRMWANGPRRG